VPSTDVFFYQEAPGNVPTLDWLRELRKGHKAAYAKCVARIQRLAELGHELRRPESDFLRDGIHELRAKRGRVNYRILYFFHGRNVAFLAHALTKEGAVPNAEIDCAVRRRRKLERNPAAHTYAEDLAHAQESRRRKDR
jgi:phage-related protein